MGRITAECETRIKDSADIVELLGRYLELRRSGYAWKACCPFHNEKTPSFHINPTRQTFHCFGCGVGGDSIKFLMLYENLSYPDALRRLADMNGIEIREEEENPEVIRRRKLRQRVVELNKLAAEYYHYLLCKSPEAAPAREYLKSRSINIEMAREWMLGWAPAQFQGLQRMAEEQHFNRSILEDANLLSQGRTGSYPVFRERLMFPIRDLRSHVVGFSGRILDSEKDPRKYVNTADTIAFHKGDLLFGLDKATRGIGQSHMTALLCEGQIDVIACHEKAGITNAVAGLGTAFTDEQARLLKKYAKRTILCYDGDQAGIKASEKAYRKLAAAGMEVYQVSLPDGEDPDSLIESQGAETLKKLVAEARPYLELRCRYEMSRADMSNAHTRASLVNQMVELASEVTDSTYRDLSLTDLATRLQTGLDSMREQLREVLQAKQQAAQKQRPQQQQTSDPNDEIWEEDIDIMMVDEMVNLPPQPPTKIHPAIRGILVLAAGHTEAQALLVDRIEELQEPIHALAGGSILSRILEALPHPHEAEDWQRFLASLEPAERKALQGFEAAPADLPQIDLYVDQACERAACDSLKVQIDMIRSRMRDPQQPEELKLQDLDRITKLQRLLNSAGEQGIL